MDKKIPSPRTKVRYPSEQFESEMFALWLDTNGYRNPVTRVRQHHHSPNEGKPGERGLGKLVAMGFSPGFPDHMIMLKCCRAGYIEMKRVGGTIHDLTKEQAIWLSQLAACGGLVKVSFGHQDAIETVQRWELSR